MAGLTAIRSWARLPAPARIALIYLAARLVTTGFLAAAAASSGVDGRFGADATLGDFVTGWDGRWFWTVATTGYPGDLPVSSSGGVAENAWAFMPVYGWAAMLVGLPFRSWAVGAALVSLAAGYGASLMLYRLLRQRIDRASATWAVVFFASGPLAALFHVGYAESLFLLLLLTALDQLMRRRYDWLFVLIPLMGFTRPGVLAFALTLGLYGVWRWTRRRHDPLPGREIAAIIALGALAVVVGFAWQLIAGVVTGVDDAYLQTELSWRAAWGVSVDGPFVPFGGWFQAVGAWAGLQAQAGVVAVLFAGLVVLVPLIGIWAVLFDQRVRRLGVEPRLWAASYLLYLVAVFFPQSSVLRLLLPLTPLVGALALPRSRVWRCSVLILCLVLQWAWILAVYGLGNTFWRVP